jgi:hypothetical protein
MFQPNVDNTSQHMRVLLYMLQKQTRHGHTRWQTPVL